MATMIAARLHKYGEPMTLDRIEVPQPRPTDVLVEVKACGVVPNMARVVSNFFGTNTSALKTLPLPAIFGLDPTGVVTQVGDQVRSIAPGQRVYVNPARRCGSCRMCRSGQPLDCPDFSFQGYFGRSQDIMQAYPYGGFSQYITAPEYSLVRLPGNVSFENAARFGYLGTCYSAMKKLGVGPGVTFLVNGISGQLGLGAAQLALAMSCTRILGTGRNVALLKRVKALSPHRIEVFSFSNEKADGVASGNQPAFIAWAKGLTEGQGVDASLDCLPPGAPAAAMMGPFLALRRGGHGSTVGAVMEMLPLNAFWLMTNRITLQGSVWFTTGEGEEMAAMASAGTLDLSALKHKIYPLTKINELMTGMDERDGGFTNFIVDPIKVN
jgi:D-arabinose 1-dehydrogenase-like Zn-dependent alcohol dehydrogenase